MPFTDFSNPNTPPPWSGDIDDDMADNINDDLNDGDDSSDDSSVTVTVIGGPPPGMPPGFPGMPSMGSSNPDYSDIEELLVNYNEKFKDAQPTLFRDDIIKNCQSVLISKLKPNPLLLGPAGVGKTRIVEDIARRIANDDPTVAQKLKNTTIYELPLSTLIAGQSHVGQLEQRITKLIDYATDEDNDVIIFIDEIHQIFKSSDPILSKVAQSLKPALARGDMRVIGATTLSEGRSIKTDPALQRRFTTIAVPELSPEQTLHILEMVAPSYSDHHDNIITIDKSILPSVVSLADTYNRGKNHRPDNALTLLDRSVSRSVIKHSHLIADGVLDTIALKYSECERTALALHTGKNNYQPVNIAECADDLKGTILGQDHIIDPLIDSIARYDLKLFNNTKPLSILFAGPSGTGKTHTAKIISQHLTDEDPIILNMSEYTESSAVNRILGASAGYVGFDSNQELPFDSLATNPRRVIILDEIEKADIKVIRTFLSVFDEGYLTTAKGDIIDFSACVIIATTNAGAETLINDGRGFGFNTQSEKNLDHNTIKKALSPYFDSEFLGRFSHIFAYKSIDKATYTDIIKLNFAQLIATMRQDYSPHANLFPDELDDTIASYFAEHNYHKAHGARSAAKVVRTYIENVVMDSLHYSGTTPYSSALYDAQLLGETTTSDSTAELDSHTD